MSINKGENSALLLKKDRSVAELYKGDTKLFGYNSYAEGETISVDNVHPIEHKMRVGVKSKNLLPCQAASQTLGGVEFTVNEDGSIAVNGTASENILFQVSEITLGKGKYRLSGCPVIANSSTNCCLYCLASEANTYCFDTGNGNALVPNLPTTAKVYIRIAPNFECKNLIFYPMLSIGVKAADYTQHVDVTSLTVTMRGKNLFKFDKSKVSASNGAFELTENGAVFTGNAAGGSNQWTSGVGNFNNKIHLKKGLKVTISADYTWLDISNFRSYPYGIYLSGKNLAGTTINHNNSFIYETIEQDVTKRISYSYTIKETGYYNVIFTLNSCKVKIENIQVSCSNDTEYEEYKCDTYTPICDGTVEGITSTSPYMTVTTDTDGTVIECEYVDNT